LTTCSSDLSSQTGLFLQAVSCCSTNPLTREPDYLGLVTPAAGLVGRAGVLRPTTPGHRAFFAGASQRAAHIIRLTTAARPPWPVGRYARLFLLLFWRADAFVRGAGHRQSFQPQPGDERDVSRARDCLP